MHKRSLLLGIKSRETGTTSDTQDSVKWALKYFLETLRQYCFNNSAEMLGSMLLELEKHFAVPLWLGQRCMFPGRGWGWRWGHLVAAGCWLELTPQPCPWSVWVPVSSQNDPGSSPLGKWCCVWHRPGWPPGWRQNERERKSLRLNTYRLLMSIKCV